MLIHRNQNALAAARQASLDKARQGAINAVNLQVSNTRRAFITDLPGQEMVYLNKQSEAVAFLSDPAPDINLYPAIRAEVSITASSPYEVAQLWLNMANIWRFVSAEIEAVRLDCIKQINACEDADAMSLCVDNAYAALVRIENMA